jgi:hypothetical protein
MYTTKVTEQQKKQRSNLRRRCRDRVKRGAALLDRERPGWEGKMDISKFDIWEPNRCILGQVFMNGQFGSRHNTSGYSRGLIALKFAGGDDSEDEDVTEEKAAHYGFTIGLKDEYEIDGAGIYMETVWEWLAVYWIREIEIRRQHERT